MNDLRKELARAKRHVAELERKIAQPSTFLVTVKPREPGALLGFTWVLQVQAKTHGMACQAGHNRVLKAMPKGVSRASAAEARPA